MRRSYNCGTFDLNMSPRDANLQMICLDNSEPISDAAELSAVITMENSKTCGWKKRYVTQTTIQQKSITRIIFLHACYLFAQ